jgi:hypothetical protein
METSMPAQRLTPDLAVPGVMPVYSPSPDSLIREARDLAQANPNATAALLYELARDIRAGQTHSTSTIEKHANRLRRATPIDQIPVFVRARRSAIRANDSNQTD